MRELIDQDGVIMMRIDLYFVGQVIAKEKGFIVKVDFEVHGR
jgi:hypothetical protein